MPLSPGYPVSAASLISPLLPPSFSGLTRGFYTQSEGRRPGWGRGLPGCRGPVSGGKIPPKLPGGVSVAKREGRRGGFA